MEWKHEQEKTILDREQTSGPSEVELPAPGTVLEKMYANKKSTPIQYRRNREWTDYNWRKPEQWQSLYNKKKVSDVRRDCIFTRNEEAIYRLLNEKLEKELEEVNAENRELNEQRMLNRQIGDDDDYEKKLDQVPFRNPSEGGVPSEYEEVFAPKN